MLTTEQEYLLDVLSDYLNGRQTKIKSDINWLEIRRLAQNHQVSGIVYRQCKEFIPNEWYMHFAESVAAELFYYKNRVKIFEKVSASLSEKEIPFYTVKGLEVAQLYPVPALRTMGDCDIVVYSEDKEQAHAVMVDLGFETLRKMDMDWVYIKDQIEFEIHDHLLYDELGNTLKSRNAVDLAWEYARPMGEGTRYTLDWSFHFLFLLLHLKKHLIHSGVGFRQFMDLTVVMRECNLDWPWIEDVLRDLELHRFAARCFQLLNYWFNTPIPIACAEPPEVFYEEATKSIFANGIFGFHNEANRSNGKLNALTQRNGPRWLVRVEKMLDSIFPSYRDMRFVSHYKFLNGRPYLLPITWLYRFFRAIRYHMSSHGKQMIENALIPDERLDRRERELDMWGLR